MHARKSGVQSTKPKIAKLPTGTTKKQDDEEEKDELLEQQESLQPGVLIDPNERVGAHVVGFTALKGYIATYYQCGRYPTMSNRVVLNPARPKYYIFRSSAITQLFCASRI